MCSLTHSATAVTVTVVVNAPGDPRDHMNALMRVLLPFARDSIQRYGGFYPFGASMAADGELDTATGPGNRDGEAEPETVLEAIRTTLKVRADRGEVIATGICSEVTIDDGDFPLGIRVEMEHRDDEPVTCVVPYRRSGEGFEYGDVFAYVGERRTFE
jgi:hypothetical protein